jgi:hypothetical protein
MTAIKKRIGPYIVFILLGGICVYLSGLIAGFAAYQKGNGPPSGAGSISMSIKLDRSRYDDVKSLLLSEKEGNLISEDEFIEFKRNQPRAEMNIGSSRGSKSVLCFATELWALRVSFDDKGIAIAKEMKW